MTMTGCPRCGCLAGGKPDTEICLANNCPDTHQNTIHPDESAVDRFAAAMKAKLERKRQHGRGGWETCSNADLWRMLREHVEKGDPVDVANLAMMIHQNSEDGRGG